MPANMIIIILQFNIATCANRCAPYYCVYNDVHKFLKENFDGEILLNIIISFIFFKHFIHSNTNEKCWFRRGYFFFFFFEIELIFSTDKHFFIFLFKIKIIRWKGFQRCLNSEKKKSVKVQMEFLR